MKPKPRCSRVFKHLKMFTLGPRFSGVSKDQCTVQSSPVLVQCSPCFRTYRMSPETALTRCGTSLYTELRLAEQTFFVHIQAPTTADRFCNPIIWMKSSNSLTKSKHSSHGYINISARFSHKIVVSC